MATQTQTQRQAAAKRAAATRKRNAAKRSAGATKSSARRTRTVASGAAGGARSTARTAGTTTAHGADAAVDALEATGTRLGAAARHAQRAVLIPVGALATAGDSVRRIALTYATSRSGHASSIDSSVAAPERSTGGAAELRVVPADPVQRR